MSILDKINKIAKGPKVTYPGDLAHMDKAEFSSPGRLLANTGMDNKK